MKPTMMANTHRSAVHFQDSASVDRMVEAGRRKYIMQRRMQCQSLAQALT